MSKLKILRSVVNEYGIFWVIHRTLYSVKLKMLNTIPLTEKIFEKKVQYPSRVNLFTINNDSLKKMLESLGKQDKEQLINDADNACQGIIRGFSNVNLDYGNPINWQFNPITQKSCSIHEKWYKIPDFDTERGDVKIIWEASRLSHFITLARAYLLTKDIKYYNAYSGQLKWWLEANPYNYGVNYKCGQECALRMMNTLLAFSVFKNAEVITETDICNVKELIARCYKKILSNFFYAYKCIKNNHTISELVGMIVGAWCCRDLKQLYQSFSILNKVIGEQFFEDGGYKQFSFNYQRVVLQDLEYVLAIEDTVGIQLSEKSKKKIKAAAFLMYQCQDEYGNMPNYGPNDGSLVFPVTSCDYRDFKPVINTVYALVTGMQLYEKGKHQEELVWFSNKKLEEYRFQKVIRCSSQFSKAGLYTLRNGKTWAMLVLNEYHSRPAHLDQLHFDLWVNHENVFCDAGTYSYASELGKILVQNSSHNTAVVTGKSQMKTYGPFMVYDWTKCELRKCEKNTFEGKMISKCGYEHVRKIEYHENEYIIHDTVFCNTEWKILFHTTCDIKLEDKTIVLSKRGMTICELNSDGIIQVEDSKYSLYYLRANENKCISIRSSSDRNKICTKIKIIKGRANE